MSMDDQLAQMERFRHELRAFNERLDAAARELGAAHERLSPLWQDSFRRDYDAQYTPFAERLDRYRAQEAPAYEQFEQFLDQKMAALRRYLFGT
jgi:hypothetical protein